MWGQRVTTFEGKRDEDWAIRSEASHVEERSTTIPYGSREEALSKRVVPLWQRYSLLFFER